MESRARYVKTLRVSTQQGLQPGVSREKFLTDERKKKMELVVVKYVNLEQQRRGPGSGLGSAHTSSEAELPDMLMIGEQDLGNSASFQKAGAVGKKGADGGGSGAGRAGEGGGGSSGKGPSKPKKTTLKFPTFAAKPSLSPDLAKN
jgi:hypothetical protein